MNVLGIDPGLAGGLTLINRDLRILHTLPMSTEDWRKGKKAVNAAAVNRMLSEFQIDLVIVEDVHASPQMGVTSAFSFGYGYGVLHGALQSAGMKTVRVPPAKWKGDMKVPADKKITIARAAILFKADAAKLLKPRALKKDKFGASDFHEGCTEAALIAAWGVRYYNSE